MNSAIPARLLANTEAFIGADELAGRLAEDRPLRVKLGVDPTRPDLTLGHLVVFNKLRQFQDEGHQAVLIIGDFTTLIGDPSGRDSTRPELGKAEIEANAATYLEQAFKVLDPGRTTVRRNSEWFGQMGFEDALALARRMTVARMLERDDFAQRYRANTPISIVEFLYPLLQGYDSLVVEADVELGGTDQLFNLLVGRALQKEDGVPEQAVVTMPLLVGTDGVKKMSKSLDNYIAFNDAPVDVFGKVMSIKDELIGDYHRLLLDTPDEEIERVLGGHPNEEKKRLAAALTELLHGAGAARYEAEQWEFDHGKKRDQDRLRDDLPVFPWADLSDQPTGRVANLMAATGLFPSKKEVRRLIEQGAVKVDGERCNDAGHELSPPAGGAETVVQAGKRIGFKIVP